MAATRSLLPRDAANGGLPPAAGSREGGREAPLSHVAVRHANAGAVDWLASHARPSLTAAGSIQSAALAWRRRQGNGDELSTNHRGNRSSSSRQEKREHKPMSVRAAAGRKPQPALAKSTKPSATTSTSSAGRRPLTPSTSTPSTPLASSSTSYLMSPDEASALNLPAKPPATQDETVRQAAEAAAAALRLAERAAEPATLRQRQQTLRQKQKASGGSSSSTGARIQVEVPLRDEGAEAQAAMVAELVRAAVSRLPGAAAAASTSSGGGGSGLSRPVSLVFARADVAEAAARILLPDSPFAASVPDAVPATTAAASEAVASAASVASGTESRRKSGGQKLGKKKAQRGDEQASGSGCAEGNGDANAGARGSGWVFFSLEDGNVERAAQASARSQLAVVVGPTVQQAPSMLSFCLSVGRTPVLVVNPEWIGSKGLLDAGGSSRNSSPAAVEAAVEALGSAFSVAYSFTPLAVQGLLGSSSTSILLCPGPAAASAPSGGRSAGAAPWVLFEERAGGSSKRVAVLRRRPSAEELQALLYASMAAESPVSKSIQFVRSLLGKG